MAIYESSSHKQLVTAMDNFFVSSTGFFQCDAIRLKVIDYFITFKINFVILCYFVAHLDVNKSICQQSILITLDTTIQSNAPM